MKFLNNKKAVQTVLMGLIIILIVLIIMVLIVRTYNEKIGEQAAKDLCRVSVLSKSKTKAFGVEGGSYLNCPANYIEINKDGIFFNDEKDVNLKGKTKQEKEEIIKRFLANQLYDCWYQFGEGKIDFLGDWDVGIWGDKRCFPCAKIELKDNFLTAFTYGDFEQYLRDTIYFKKSTYGDYMFPFYNNKFLIKPDYNNENLNQGKTLTIAFIAFKSSMKADDFYKNMLKSPYHWVFKNNFYPGLLFIDTVDVPDKCGKLY